jgi:uncharacterized protein (DUF433 family)
MWRAVAIGAAEMVLFAVSASHDRSPFPIANMPGSGMYAAPGETKLLAGTQGYLTLIAMKSPLPVAVDPEVLSGTPVFVGTRVPVETLFNYILDGVTLDAFLENFPSVKRADAVRLLESLKEIVQNGTAA